MSYYVSFYCPWVDRDYLRELARQEFNRFLDRLFGRERQLFRVRWSPPKAIRRSASRICHERARPRLVRCRNS